MADKKISDLNAITGANTADGDLFVIVDTSANETKSITKAELFNQDITIGGNLTVQGTTITIDSATAQTVDLGDNDKIRLGDGDDLQIYHDSATSTNKVVGSIDVTGTVTADGLTVSGSDTTDVISTSVDTMRIKRSTSGGGVRLKLENGDSNYFQLQNNGAELFTLDYNGTNVFAANNNGDISFYEDTGTTAKFFWDASAESLGIGTTSPAQLAHLFEATADTGAFLQVQETGGQNAYFGVNTSGGSIQVSGANHLQIATNGTEAMRIDSSGNVGIGTSSPTERLEVFDDDVQIKLRDTSAYSAGTGPTIGFQGKDSNENIKQFAQIRGVSVSSDNGALAFDTRTGGSVTERMRIDSSGNLDLTNGGGDIIMANGAGIDFSASEGGGATSSILDDYEEGTFDPTVGGVDVGTGVYRKIGDLIFIEIVLTANSISTDTIGGLPFNISSASGYGGLLFGRMTNCDVLDSNGVPCRMNFSFATIEFRQNSLNASDGSFTITSPASGTVRIGISGVGRVT